MKRLFPSLLAVVIAILVPGTTRSQDFLSGAGPQNPVRIDQRLNQQVPADLKFRDETGRSVRIGDYFGSKPIVLSLVYYRCPMLCPMTLEGLTSSLANIRFEIGKEYEVLTVSFDPRDTPQDAAEKKEIYDRRYGREGAKAGWHFLTGDEKSIRALTNAVGFHYQYDAKEDQFAHGTGVILLTPKGKIARYFYGIDFPARDLRLGLVEASNDKIGSPTDQLLLLCFHYDPATGKYSRVAMNAIRVGGLATVLGIAGSIFFMLRRDRKKVDAIKRDR